MDAREEQNLRRRLRFCPMVPRNAADGEMVKLCQRRAVTFRWECPARKTPRRGQLGWTRRNGHSATLGVAVSWLYTASLSLLTEAVDLLLGDLGEVGVG